MNPNYISQFLTTTYTKHQALTRFRILTDFLNFRLFISSSISEVDSVSNQFNKFKANYDHNVDLDVKFFSELDPSFFAQFKTDNVNTLLPELSRAINSKEICVIYLPFVLPEPEIEKLGLWFKGISANQLIEIKYDGGLIGGVAFSYKGIYQDFSLKEKIKENNTKITETLLSFKK